jgi:magnesium-transporting ATPase (P-type)
MTGNDEPKREPTPSPERQRTPLPQGYRQGIITAITVLLGFSLTFFRFWGFEAEGEWTPRSIFATSILIVSVVMQIITLFRSLRIADDDEIEYGKTVRWFIASVFVLIVAVLIAVVAFSGEFEHERR